LKDPNTFGRFDEESIDLYPIEDEREVMTIDDITIYPENYSHTTLLFEKFPYDNK
jgi:hypothetical protein